MSKTNIEKSAKLSWYVGSGVWCLMIALLWWHLHEAQTFAQASLRSTRLISVCAITLFWSTAGAAWLKQLRKTRITSSRNFGSLRTPFNQRNSCSGLKRGTTQSLDVELSNLKAATNLSSPRTAKPRVKQPQSRGIVVCLNPVKC
jgi:hypothetical protein